MPSRVLTSKLILSGKSRGVELRRVERRAGEEKVDGDVTRNPGQVAGEPRGRSVAILGVILPNGRQPVVFLFISREIGVVDIPVVGERVWSCREVVEPDAPRGAQAALLVVCGGATPGNELAAVVLLPKLKSVSGSGSFVLV